MKKVHNSIRTKRIVCMLWSLIALVCLLSACGGENSDSSSEGSTSNNDVWEIKYYVDEFKQPTSKRYLTTTSPLVGTFSDVVTTNSELQVVPLIDDYKIAFALYENGSHRVKNIYTHDLNYVMTIRTSDGKDSKYIITLAANADRFSMPLYSDAYKQIMELLNGEDDFHILISDERSTSYLFTVTPGNFKDLY